MIIDSHAHYAYNWFNNSFKYLDYCDGEYVIKEAKNREELIEEMRKREIYGFIEPSIGFDNIENQLLVVKKHSDFMWSAIGVHPTRCIHTPWKKRKEVARIAEKENPVAIGETGLDYHYPRKKQHRLKQIMWFIYQINLAHRMKLPLVLHVRKADRDAIKILKLFKKRLHGGVAHCFTGNATDAIEYEKLGFTLGIGGKVLNDNEEGRAIGEAVKSVALTSLLVETDAPYVMPDAAYKSGRKKLCNTSLILPAIIEKMADLRGLTPYLMEVMVYYNTLRAFNIEDPNPEKKGGK